MKNRLLYIYDWFNTHRRLLWIGLIVIVLPLVGLAVSLRYNENIMDFLPATEEERAEFKKMQSQQSASRLVLIIEGDSLCEEAIDLCAERIPDLQTELDLSEQLEPLYSHMPCFISDSMYDRFDSLFTSQAIHDALVRDKTILSTPGASLLIYAIQSDPLGLIPLTNFQNNTADKERAFGFYDSPYGGTETQHNASLIDSLQSITNEVVAHYPHLKIRWVGAPVIAVGNAKRIKTDTLICIALSLLIIITLLAYAFPRRRDLWLIVLAVSFGWLTGMAALRIVTPAVSAIVLGIGSVLIGIAVNYPLHLLVHQRYTSSVRQTLEEVLSPLVVGNITTVAAFMALVPLQATAMRHLGIFAAAMLIGTILFCVFILPHLMSAAPTPVREIKLPIPHLSPNTQYLLQIAVLWITVLLGAYLLFAPSSGSPIFDSNLSHINYMTDQQRADMALFESKRGDASQWETYWKTHDKSTVINTIQTEAIKVGFKPEAFNPFYQTLQNAQTTPPFELSNLAKRLSEDFDYIGLCCSLIVFLFLWFSFRDIWLALIAFVPMALSWVWIFGLMQLLGLQFNIVNIILATFIFGQGDDYTIFIVEGLLFEYRTGKQILPQYRQSILLSALIMLIGIGILAFAVHPAMHSLGVITLIGMSIVLIMAMTIPPLLFKVVKRFVK